MKNQLVGSVAEPDMVEDEGPRLDGKAHGLWVFTDCLRNIEHSKYAERRSFENPDLCDELREPLQRLPQLTDIIHEDDEKPDRHPTLNRGDELITVHEVAAVAQDNSASYSKNAVTGQGVELLLNIQAQQRPNAASHRPAEAAELIGFAAINLSQRDTNHRLLDEAGQIGIDLFRRQSPVMDAHAKAPVAPDDERGDRKGREGQGDVARQENGRHDRERHRCDACADDGVHDAPGTKSISGQPVDRVTLWPTAVVGEAELLEFGEQIVADPRGAAVVQLIVDHHPAEPGKVADDVKRHADQDEANHLSNFTGWKKPQEQAMHPVA